MKLFIASLAAATLLTSITATTASATTCNVVAAHVTGDGNFVDLDVSGCGYTSTHLRGSYSFAQIINHLGAVVTGIYGNNHYYQVHNNGDNDLGIVVNGTWHRTHVTMRGDNNTLDLVQDGAPSSVSVNNNGNGNQFRIRTR